MKNLDPFAISLDSLNLIEASAGTGKSWTVTLLYLRLILEKNFSVEQILVVTFTDAATKELRDDIRKRLLEALSAFEDEHYAKEDEYLLLKSKMPELNQDINESIRRLKRARLSLDEATIFTIHGFCQRALSENAFQSALPFESELLENDHELMQKLVDDFWRRNFYQAPAALLFKLAQKRITPDSLLADIYTAVGKPYLQIMKPQSGEPDAKQWAVLEEKFEAATSAWKTYRSEIISLLDNPELSKAYYKGLVNNRDAAFNMMDELCQFNQPPSQLDTKCLVWLGNKEKTTAKFASLEHPFFQIWQDFLDLWEALNQAADDYLNHLRIRLLNYLQTELPKEKQKLGVLSFDDLLLQLEKALRNNPQLAGDLRKKYKAALIDEFQDTDPIQYEIFNTIFANQEKHPVFLVGDPKQAIYSFRGGDIHTYLKAKADTSENRRYTIKTNWRSHPNLVAALNTLYSPIDNPFQDKGIDYIEVDAGNIVNDELITPDNRPALRFWQQSAITTEGEKKNLAMIRDEIASSLANDIAALLNSANEGLARIGDSPISGGDIAVLVRSHTQGNLIKQALNARGIASVQSSRENIFQTHEAVEIHRLLSAIAEPHREDNVRRALVTELMGYRASHLLEFENDSNAWEEKLLAIQNWHNLWKKKGFLQMMRDLMRSEHLYQHLLAFSDAERRLTNILQLSELIHKEIRKQSFSMEETLRWLQQQQQNPNSSETELRLESDEDLVKIVTIHKSKGLEYPIVYCPFVGIGGASHGKSNCFIFHENEQACFEIGSPDISRHKELKAEEERAEDCRLLYVALTRAKYQCTVVCMPEPIYRSPDKTALGWLLSNAKSPQADKEKFYQAYTEQLAKLARHDAIEVADLPENKEIIPYTRSEEKQELIAKSFDATIKQQAKITSFSGLTAGAHSEAPDYDTTAISMAAVSENAISQANDANDTVAEFPKGAAAGSVLHEIYENIDFTQPLNAQDKIISETLNKWGFEQEYKNAAIDLLENSLQTPLFNELKLGKLSDQQRLNEMEFYLPLKPLQTDKLKQILFQHLPQEWQVVRDAVDTLYFDRIEGYLKGYIDLIFEYQGKFYVVDYKSNTLNDYSQESLLETMAESHYYLQYLLYSVALHRYLKKRRADYAWETHFGGAYYLFIRGMSPMTSTSASISKSTNEKYIKKGGDGYLDTNPDYSGENPGVFYHKPDFALIEAMDSLFGESLL